MKLIDHVLKIRRLIQQAIDNRFSRLGLEEQINQPTVVLHPEQQEKRAHLDQIVKTHQEALEGDYVAARQEAINECTFTLFNRLAALKVMEDRELFPEVIRRRAEHSNLSYAHIQWLEENAEERTAERMGLKHFLESKFEELASTYGMPLYSPDYVYALFPTADELDEIIVAFNDIEKDADCGEDVWKGDDILGWMYENFNTVEKLALKDSGEKTEYDKVSLQSQVYTPQWVVKFLVDNTLGKIYLEMYPDSNFLYDEETGKQKYMIANAPSHRVREVKKLEEIRLIDPACGSGNFLIYAFSMFYDLYMNQIDQYNADYSRRDIPKLIVENNLYGVDLDERAVQLTQIALYIKAMQLKGRRGAMPTFTHVVSTHFELPEYKVVEQSFVDGNKWDEKQQSTIKNIWEDLRNAYKFGSLVRVKERLEELMPKEGQLDLFTTQTMDNMFTYKHQVMTNLRNQLGTWQGNEGYMKTKVNDALTFLDILSNPFDVAVANPPYTDSADFGKDLKAFVEENYKRPLKFNSNLYASFIKRCCELTDEDGKVGMIHPMTFMYIKSFEDVRKFILDETHINLFVEYGLSSLFGSIMVDPAFYVLEKRIKGDSRFISLDQYTRTPEEKNKKEYCLSALDDIIGNRINKHVYQLPQEKLKKIKSYPFIYWISDDFREKFKDLLLEEVVDIKQGIATSNNNRFLRFWWEEQNSLQQFYPYSKGGPYQKWVGNLWLCISWNEQSIEFINKKGRLQNKNYYFREGITYSGSGSKGTSFRILPQGCLFDVGGSCIFPTEKFTNRLYLLAFLNSKICFYIASCLNPTVNTQVGDLQRVPFVIPLANNEQIITTLSQQCVNIKQHLSSFSIIEQSFSQSPLSNDTNIQNAAQRFYDYENFYNTFVLLNESVINDVIFKVYDLSDDDRKMVIDKQGLPVGDYPVSQSAKTEYLKWLTANTDFTPELAVLNHIDELETNDDLPQINDFDTLYQNNNGWEEFCIKHKMNPIEVWYQFKNANVLPPQRTQVLTFELLTDIIRAVLAKDDDGVIPLVERMGEEQLSSRIEQEFVERGYNGAQIAQIIQLLGMPLERFLQEKFFDQLSNHLNLFMYLPKTPFIWHLTSGTHHAMELYVSIYKWSRDTLFRIKSVYIANRESSLNDSLSVLDTSTANGQIEADEIKEQLKELKIFAEKIDGLLANGYDPKLDDGVGKNIAPLQKSGLLSYEVLNAGQLKKYLNADW